MDSYETLIRLKKREIDALRVQMGVLTDQQMILERLLETLAGDLNREFVQAGELVHMGVFFGDFSEDIKQKQVKVHEKLRALHKQMDALAQKMTAVFAEQKKYEIVQQRHEAEARRKQDAREQRQLDEVASMCHRAKGGSDALPV